jgi:hypothetical protein
LKAFEELRKEGVIPAHGKPIREWEEVTLDRLLQTLRELADERMVAELKARNRLN